MVDQRRAMHRLKPKFVTATGFHGGLKPGGLILHQAGDGMLRGPPVGHDLAREIAEHQIKINGVGIEDHPQTLTGKAAVLVGG